MADLQRTATSPIRFRILYCGPCGYESRAHDLAEELRVLGADVEIEEGRFGQFDVLLDGRLVASKGGFWRRVTIHGEPPQEKLLASIEKHLAVRDGDACEIGPAHQTGRASEASTGTTLALIRSLRAPPRQSSPVQERLFGSIH